MDEEFKTYHLGVVDLLEEEQQLENEQAMLDDHDDVVAGEIRLATTSVKETVTFRMEPLEGFHDNLWYCQRTRSGLLPARAV